MSVWSSVYENKVHLTKPFKASQSWHQLSVYENKVLVQTLFTKWTDFNMCKNRCFTNTNFHHPGTIWIQYQNCMPEWCLGSLVKLRQSLNLCRLILLHYWVSETKLLQKIFKPNFAIVWNRSQCGKCLMGKIKYKLHPMNKNEIYWL